MRVFKIDFFLIFNYSIMSDVNANELNIDNFNLSNEAIIKCSKVSDPILTALAAAKTIGKDRELKAILEHTLANYLDQHTEMYELMEKQNPRDILITFESNIFDHSIIKINNVLSNIIKEINIYLNDEHFIISKKENDNYSHSRLIYCDKKDDNYELYKQLSDDDCKLIKVLDARSTVIILAEHINSDIKKKCSIKNIQIPIMEPVISEKNNILYELSSKIKSLIGDVTKYLYGNDTEYYTCFVTRYVNGKLSICLSFSLFINNKFYNADFKNDKIFNKIKYEIQVEHTNYIDNLTKYSFVVLDEVK